MAPSPFDSYSLFSHFHLDAGAFDPLADKALLSYPKLSTDPNILFQSTSAPESDTRFMELSYFKEII
jgi:hypothetical protein